MNTSMLQAMPGVRNVIHLVAPQPSETALILTDWESDPSVAQAVMLECASKGVEHALLYSMEADLDRDPGARSTGRAMAAADIILGVFDSPMPHSRQRTAALRKGSRYLHLLAQAEALSSAGAAFPLPVIFALCRKLFDQWQAGRSIRITSETGTDLTAKIVDPSYVVGGPMHPLEPGTFEVFEGGTGDVGLWPAWTGDGVLVFDGLGAFRESFPLDERVRVTVREGRAVAVDGHPVLARRLNELLQAHPDANHLGELMICLNPAASLDRGLREATRHAGCLHAGFGYSIDIYKDPRDRTSLKEPSVYLEIDGKPFALVDNLILKPTVYIDNQLCVENGRLLALEDPEVRDLLVEAGWNGIAAS